MDVSKVSLREKISYVLVNLGNIPIMTLISSYLLIFYTNVCGLSPADCATLFLVARILDGVNDPFVGYIIDHLPNTRFGHFRPPLIVGTILCSLNFLLLWFGPMVATSGKLVIAYVSYILIGILFPVMDISLNSMLPVMTTDMNERNTLSSIKGLFYMLGVLAIGMSAPLILGDTSNKDGYIRLVLIVTVAVIVMTVLGATGLKERVKPKAGKKYGIKDMFNIMSQKPIWSTFAASIFYMVGFTVMNTVNIYYFSYIMNDLKLFSLVAMVQIVAIFPAMLMVSKLTQKMGKKRLYMLGLFVFGVLPVVRLIAPTSQVLLMLITVFIGFGQGLCMPLTYGIQADNTDYIELKTGQRAEGAVASLSSFTTKFSMGIGGAIPGYLLAYAGFNATLAAQPAMVHKIILICIAGIPMILTVIGILVFGKFYPISQQELDKQVIEINEMRSLKEV